MGQALWHIAEHFRWRALTGHPERLGRLPAGAGAGGGIVNNGGNLEAARPHDLEYWAWKTQAEDMKNAKTFLQ